MTTDISTLVRVVRRADAASTLRSFLVVLAPFVVIWNIAAIGAAARFFFSEDSFFDDEDSLLVAGILVISALAAFAPLGFLVREWAARREVGRQFSVIMGAILGSVGLLLLTAALSGLLYGMEEDLEPVSSMTMLGQVACVVAALMIGLLTWLLIDSRWVARTLVAILAVPFVLLVLSLPIELILDEEQDLQGTAMAVAGTLLALVAVALIMRQLVRAIRLRIILAGDVPRNLLFGAFVRKGLFVRLAQIAGLPSSLWSASATLTLTFWVLILARPVTYVGAAFLFKDREQVENWQALVTAGVMLIIAGHVMFYAGKRLAARSSWRPERPGAARAPILFLRSFQDDQLQLRRPWWNLTARWLDIWSFRRNVDEALVDEIAQYGPVVALGQPGEKKAPFGAMRHYATHEDWQSIVDDTARRAQAIVIVAGDSPGVLWEFELLARHALVERTLLLFRPGFQDMNKRALELFCRATGSAVPIAQQDRQMIALVQSRGDPVLLTAQSASAEAYLVALRAHFQKVDADVLARSEVLIEDAAAARASHPTLHNELRQM